MSQDRDLQAIRDRLSQLMDLVCEQAAKDEDFRKSLQKTLGVKSSRKKTKFTYDLFGRYGELDNDLELLRQDLTNKAHEELVSIATSKKLAAKKTLLDKEAVEIIDLIIQYVQDDIKSWSNSD